MQTELGGDLGDLRAVRPGDHVCWSFTDRLAFYDDVTAYIAAGLGAGERVACYLPADQAGDGFERIRTALHEAGLAPKAGSFVTGSVEDAYLPGGRFDVDKRIGDFLRMARDTRNDGFTNLRVIADAGLLLQHDQARHEWPAYELRADLLTSRHGIIGTCAYQIDQCDPTLLGLVGAVHSHANTPSETAFRLHSGKDGALVLSGEVDYAWSETIGELTERVAGALATPVIDLAELTFIDVTGMRTVIHAATVLAGHRGSVTIKASPAFLRLWELLPSQPEIPLEVVAA